MSFGRSHFLEIMKRHKVEYPPIRTIQQSPTQLSARVQTVIVQSRELIFEKKTLIGYPHIGKLKIKVDSYDHKDKFQNNFQKIILDMFRCTTPSSERQKTG